MKKGLVFEKPKGFTLVELLAVIVILAILLLIIMPIVINLIDEARKGALRATAYGLVKTTETKYFITYGDKIQGDRTMFFENGEMIVGRIKYTGKTPDNGKIILRDNGEISLAIHDGKYCAVKKYGEVLVTVEEKSLEKCISEAGNGSGNGNGNGEEGPSIDDLVNEGYIPVANAEELNNVRYEVENTFGAGTEWEGIYLGGVDKNYIQVADIDLTTFLSELPNGWDPLGDYEYECFEEELSGLKFTGTYNGGGFIISNLTATYTSSAVPVALFGTADGAIFENINLVDVNMVGGNDGDPVPTAGLVGQVVNEGVTINNVDITGNVATVGNSAGMVGGYVGYMTDVETVSIKNSMYVGDINSNYNRAGGLIGTARRYETILIENSHVVGDVVGSYNRIGGLIGDAYYESYSSFIDPSEIERSGLISIKTSSVAGDVISEYNKAAGIIGEVRYGTELHLEELNHNGNVLGEWGKVGGIVGAIHNVFDIKIIDVHRVGDVIGDYNKAGGFVGMIRQFDDVFIQNVSHEGDVLGDYNKSSGFIGEITDEGSDEGTKAKSLIVENIVVKGNVVSDYNKTGGIFGDIRSIEVVKISDAYYEGDIYHDYTKTGGIIGSARNLHLLEIKNANVVASIKGSDSPAFWNDFGGIIGLVASVDHTELNNVHFEGTIFDETISGKTHRVGGLVGRFGSSDWWRDYMEGYNPTVNIINSSANAMLYGSGHRIGGLIGGADYTPREGTGDEIVYSINLENSYFKGEINMFNSGLYAQVGGLVGGATDLVVKNSYALADLNIEINEAEYGEEGCSQEILTSHNISGMVGGRIIDNLTIENSYYAGNITLTKNGVEQDASYTNLQPMTTFPNLTNVISSYYDYSLLSLNDAFAHGKTSVEMREQSTYVGWDFNNVWEMNACVNNSYPYLQWQSMELDSENFCILGSNSPAQEEETLTVQVHVLNQTGSNQTKNVSLSIEGDEKYNTSVNVPANSGVNVNLNWQTEIGDAGEKIATVTVDGETATKMVTVLDLESEIELEWTFAEVGNYAGHWTSSHNLAEGRVWVRIQQSMFSGSVQRLFQWADANTVRSVRCVKSGSCSGTLSYGGQTYQTQEIGDQCWMAENLNYDGHETGLSVCYNEDSNYCSTYGRLYSLEAAKEVCPSGWDLPSDADWKTLEAALGMPAGCSCTSCDCAEYPGSGDGRLDDVGPRWEGSVGDQLRSSTWDGNNSSGLNFLPGGYGYWNIAD